MCISGTSPETRLEHHMHADADDADDAGAGDAVEHSLCPCLWFMFFTNTASFNSLTTL